MKEIKSEEKRWAADFLMEQEKVEPDKRITHRIFGKRHKIDHSTISRWVKLGKRGLPICGGSGGRRRCIDDVGMVSLAETIKDCKGSSRATTASAAKAAIIEQRRLTSDSRGEIPNLKLLRRNTVERIRKRLCAMRLIAQ